MSTTRDITNRARFLFNAAPQQFDDFLVAFIEYSSQQAINLVNTTENIQLAQGHAQQCQKIVDALREVIKNG